MMNILLIDDETYVLDSIKQKVKWEEFSVANIYAVNNIRQAKKILEVTTVHIIVCDIVMPQGTGFDLLEWVRNCDIPVQVIFLTSYAEFDYAQKAILLDSIDYLLKPIDYNKLSEAIAKAIAKVKQTENYKQYSKESEKWNKSKTQIHEKFLEDIILGRFEGKEEISDAILNRELDFSIQDSFVPLLIHFYEDDHSNEMFYRNLLNFIIRNVLEELLDCFGDQSTFFSKSFAQKPAELFKKNDYFSQSSIDKNKCTIELVVGLNDWMYYVILKNEGNTFLQKMMAICENFLLFVKNQLKLDVWCCIGEEIALAYLSNSITELKEMRENNLALWGNVTYIGNLKKKNVSYDNPLIERWKRMLKEQNEKALIDSMDTYLETFEKKEIVTLEILKKFRMDVVQLIFTYLAEQEIMAYLLFEKKESEYVYRQGLEGIKGAKSFLRHYVSKALEYISFANESKSVVDMLVAYINSHFREDVSRNDLAKIVYLNTDYISRIFKKETGLSISTYVINKRVEVAKELLSNGNMPVNAISLYVGYSNFSYFTKMFRENTGISPLEYRKKYKE